MASSNYDWLSAREHALRRPDTYAGSVVPSEYASHVFDLEGGVAKRRDIVVQVAPALLKVSDEVIVNAIDNHTRDASQKNIKLTFDKSGIFSVFNDGGTIPIELWQNTARYIPEILFGEMMSGENFNDDVKRVVGGRNGIGVKIAAILAEWFEVSIVNLADSVIFHSTSDQKLELLSKKVSDQDGARALFNTGTPKKSGSAFFLNAADDGQCDKHTLIMVNDVVYHNVGPLCYSQRFKDSLATTEPPKITRATAKNKHSSTMIRWKVNLGLLNTAAPLSDDVLALLCTRAYDAAACTHQRVAVTLNETRIPCKTIKDYALAMGGEWVGRDTIDNGPGEPSIDICIMKASDVAHGTCVGFVNGIRCSNGTHTDMVLKRIGEALSEIVKKKTKRTTTITATQLLRHLTLVIGTTIVNPAFSSQTKEKLAMRIDKLGLTYTCTSTLLRALERCGIVQALCDTLIAQDERFVSKAVKLDRSRVRSIPKYERALKLSSKQPCSLYITEGDSAKALAVAGFSVVGRDYNGVFPLKGKLVNVNDMSAQKAVENKEILHLTQILGLDPKLSYTPEKALTLPYRRLIIFTDQDHDGSHITGLVLNWLQAFFPTLLSALPDFVNRFATPIIKAKVGGETRSFFSQVEYREWLAGRTPTSVKYFKGLGTSDTEDAKRYFSNLDGHLIVMRHSGTVCSDAVNTFFNKHKTHERKDILSRVDSNSFVDYSQSQTTWTDFLHKEMVHFGTADNRRSLSNAIDGWKPSQRKVLAHALHRKKGETRVGQFASATAETMAYHHGEASLVQTVVNMAQTWVGANNVALLQPLGMFGARHMPRTEHSAERYIFTEQHQIARKIFRAEDDPILSLQEDDGKIVEPVLFAPIIPFLLINGSDGVGTGWRAYCPSYNPIELIKSTRLLVDDKRASLPEMLPWYFGYKGTIKANASEKEIVFTGLWTIESPTSIRITELPPKVWTTPYIEWIRQHLVGDEAKHFVLDIIDSSTHDDVNLLVKTKADADLANRDLAKNLKLTLTVNTRELNFFDADGNLCHYADVEAIMREHACFRHAMYEKRIKASIESMTHEYMLAMNKSRFISDVCDKRIVPSDLTSDQVRVWLRANEYYDVDDFKYLESLGIFAMTRDLSQKIGRHADALHEKLEALKQTTVEQRWRDELDELEEAVTSYMHAIQDKRMSKSDKEGKKRKDHKGESGKGKGKKIKK